MLSPKRKSLITLMIKYGLAKDEEQATKELIIIFIVLVLATIFIIYFLVNAGTTPLVTPAQIYHYNE